MKINLSKVLTSIAVAGLMSVPLHFASATEAPAPQVADDAEAIETIPYSEDESLLDLLSPEEVEGELDNVGNDIEAGKSANSALRNAIQAKKQNLVIRVYKSAWPAKKQYLTVALNGKVINTFPCSTAKERWVVPPSGRRYYAHTPTGTFNVTKAVRNYRSNTWRVNMEFALFFSGGVAIHATSSAHYRELGRPASGGCVRLRRDHAQLLWRYATLVGRTNIKVIVQ